MQARRRSHETLSQIGIGLLVVYALLQLVAPFFLPVDGHDAFIHLHALKIFPTLVNQGYWFPRWEADSFGGFGAPLFYFYPPLPYYVSSILLFIRPEATPSMLFHFTGLLATILSFIGALLFLRQLSLSRIARVIGASMYAFGPYRVFDLYVRSAFGEHVAFAIVPFVFLAVEKLLSKDRSRGYWFLALALLWTSLLITNLPSAAVMTLFLPLYIIVRAKKQGYSSVGVIGWALGFGTLTASFYLLPVLHFYPYLNASMLWRNRPLSESGNALLNLFISRTNAGPNLYGTLMLGYVVFLLPKFWSKKGGVDTEFPAASQRSIIRAAQYFIIGCLVLQLPYVMLPLFSNVPPFSIIQFGIRSNLVGLLAASILLSMYWEKEGYRIVKAFLIVWVGVGLALFVFTAFQIRMYRHITTSADPAEYLPNGTASEISTQTFQQHALDKSILTDDSSVTIASESNQPTSRSIVAEVPHPTIATFHLMAWPQWILRSDGRVIATCMDSIGRMTAELPAGRQLLTLRLERSDSEKWGELVSLIGLLALIVSALAMNWKENRTRRQTTR